MPKYKIESNGNHAFFTITRRSDGASVSLQGDDAFEFSRRIDHTNDRYTDDDVCAEYDSAMQTA